jgi:hypothetical protein
MDEGKEWSDITREEEREESFKQWLNPPVNFYSPEAGEPYEERVTRFIKVIKQEGPDRVPVPA